MKRRRAIHDIVLKALGILLLAAAALALTTPAVVLGVAGEVKTVWREPLPSLDAIMQTVPQFLRKEIRISCQHQQHPIA